MELRQSTASQEILLGPFYDDDDGVTEKTGLTIANTDIKLFKTGATTLASKNSGGATEISGGYYYAVLDATDTNTAGPLVISCKITDCLVVRHEFNVLTPEAYDAKYATGGIAALAVTIAAAVGAGQPALESYAALGALPTRDQAILMILQMLSDRKIVGTTITTRKLNGVTTAMEHTVDNADTPTDVTRSA